MTLALLLSDTFQIIGRTVSGSGTQVADATTTTTAPGVFLTRVRAGGTWATV